MKNKAQAGVLDTTTGASIQFPPGVATPTSITERGWVDVDLNMLNTFVSIIWESLATANGRVSVITEAKPKWLSKRKRLHFYIVGGPVDVLKVKSEIYKRLQDAIRGHKLNLCLRKRYQTPSIR